MIAVEFNVGTKKGASVQTGPMTIFPSQGLIVVQDSSNSLWNALSGLESPKKAEIRVDGLSLNSLTDKQRACYRYEKVGIVPQYFGLNPEESVLENLQFDGHNEQEVSSVLSEVGAVDSLHQKAIDLLPLDYRRVGLARALLKKAALVLVEEPFVGLKAAEADALLSLLIELASQRAVLLFTSEETLTKEKGFRSLVFEDGLIVSDSDPLVSSQEEKPAIPPSSCYRIPFQKKVRSAFAGLKGKVGFACCSLLLLALGASFLGFAGHCFGVNEMAADFEVLTEEGIEGMTIARFGRNSAEEEAYRIPFEYADVEALKGSRDVLLYPLFKEGGFFGGGNLKGVMELPNEAAYFSGANLQLICGNYPRNDQSVLIPESYALTLRQTGESNQDLLGKTSAITFHDSQDEHRGNYTISGIVVSPKNLPYYFVRNGFIGATLHDNDGVAFQPSSLYFSLKGEPNDTYRLMRELSDFPSSLSSGEEGFFLLDQTPNNLRQTFVFIRSEGWWSLVFGLLILGWGNYLLIRLLDQAMDEHRTELSRYYSLGCTRGELASVGLMQSSFLGLLVLGLSYGGDALLLHLGNQNLATLHRPYPPMVSASGSVFLILGIVLVSVAASFLVYRHRLFRNRLGLI